MYRLIYLVFFLSGCAALMFEALWFRQAGLAFGNSVWSASLVLSGFMGGLALGNGLMIRFGRNLSRPVFTYIILETLIAVTGLAIVIVLPGIGSWLSPFFGSFADSPGLLNFLRLAIAFIILLVPATAMGATLPVLVGAISRKDNNFGQVLGKLYGWNTLGATTGVLLTEFYFVRWLGIPGAGISAALLGFTAVFLALRVRKRLDHASQAEAGERELFSPGNSISTGGKRILIAASFAGAALLALEVVWFRFLLLFQPGTSLIFAIMLATVLCGIATGGVTTAWLYSRQFRVHRHLRLVAGLSAAMIALSYYIFPWVQSRYLLDFGSTGLQGGFVVAAIILMLPVSMASGAIFTMLGRALKDELGNRTRTTAWLTLANTSGAMLGSLVSGFIMLPVLGIENSLFIMILLYGLMAILIPGAKPDSGKHKFASSIPAAAFFMLGVLIYPFGSMSDIYLGRGLNERFPNTSLAAVREGLTETAVYLEYQKLGQPYFYRLLTNSYSMSATDEQSIRYMKLFVYLPVAIRPNPQNALLISYGVGSTARALVETDSLKSIDIVDTSKDILELSEVIYPDQESNPLNDERVTTHIEDGRFFLQLTEKKYDLITAEPPPPTVAGIVNLYTREYFGLIHERLAPGGISSYWLPAHSLEEGATKAVIRSFCEVFEDCSLWSGAGLNWILIGSREMAGPTSVESFSSQWHNMAVADELRAIGVENPAQLGSLFMAGSEHLKQATNTTLPVVDAFPYRIFLPYSGSRQFPQLYAWLMDARASAQRFTDSEFIKRHWPIGLAAETLPLFYYQRYINQRYTPGLDKLAPYSIDTLERVLLDTSLESLPLWMMGSSYFEQRLLNAVKTDPQYRQVYEWGMARRDLAERRFSEAAQRLESLRAETNPANRARLDRLYHLAVRLRDQ